MVIPNSYELLAVFDYTVYPFMRLKERSRQHIFAFTTLRMTLEKYKFNDRRIIDIFIKINHKTSEKQIYNLLTPIVTEYAAQVDLNKLSKEYNIALHNFYIVRAIRGLFDEDIKKALPDIIKPVQSFTTALNPIIKRMVT